MIKYYWYFTAYLRKHGKILAFSIIGAILFFSALIPFIANSLDTKPRMYVGVIGSHTMSNLPSFIESQISLGLTSLAPDGTVNPSLSERWIVEDDGLTYRFIIREGLVWHDGKPFEPADIDYNFSDVTTVTTNNDVVFKLPDTFVPFPTVVSQPLFRTETVRTFPFGSKQEIIGLGDYQVLEFEMQGTRLKELTLDGPTNRIIYRFYLTEPDAVTAFKHGHIDSINDLTTTYDLENWPNTSISDQLDQTRYLAVFFDNNQSIFQKNIRQGLNYATPKPDGEIRALGPINPNSWVYLSSTKPYDFDRERALERLISPPPPEPLNFTLKTTQNFVQTAEQLKQAWEELGPDAIAACNDSDDVENKDFCSNLDITVNIRIESFANTNDYQAILMPMAIPPDPDQYPLWHSEQNTNFTNYKNTRIDKLLEEGRQVAEREERRAIYQEFQQFFLEDSPAIFLQYLTNYDVTRK